MTKQGIIAAIMECAKEMGRSPSFVEVWKRKGVSRKQIRWHFGDYRKALKTCGLEGRHGGAGSQIELESLFKDWARVVRMLKRIPSLPEFTKLGKYSQTPLLTRFGVWSNVAPGMKLVMKQQGWVREWKDVLGIIEEYLRAKEEVARKRFRPGNPLLEGAELEPTSKGHPPLKGAKGKGPHRKKQGKKPREVFGHVMRCGPMLCAPTNEQGVLFLFGALAEKLGFAVLKIRAAYPDCIALVRVDEESCELVKIEFEYESRNFLYHMHEKSDCDILVCWRHNWKECPLEVVELSKYF